MTLNSVNSGERIHISFFGQRNAGKSSLVNAISGQKMSVVSDVLGTTTDPVKKAMELLPVGPVLIIDTPGYDDTGNLGSKRKDKTLEILRRTDFAVLVVDATVGFSDKDQELLNLISSKKIPYLLVFNKIDLLGPDKQESFNVNENAISVSSVDNINIDKLKEMIADLAKDNKPQKYIVADNFEPGDVIVLVVPIDESAPKGRIILPQQQVLRELLDFDCIPVVCQHTQLRECLNKLQCKPKLVITDSQVFDIVDDILDEDIDLTSFSILFAKYKGQIDVFYDGANQLDKLKDNDKVLIAEACTHHRQCNDIGTVQIPKLIEKTYGVKPDFVFNSGLGYEDDLSQFALIIHCGGCMINEKEMHSRIDSALQANVPITNYGIAIAKMKGILDRAVWNFD